MISRRLARAGLALQGAMDLGELDLGTREALADGGHDLTAFSSLAFFGQGGRDLYERHVRANRHRADPFDETAVELVSDWHRDRHPGARFEIVVPGAAILPLGRLAEELGWGRPSPVGLTINPTYGLWLAHRVVLLSENAFETDRTEPAHACDSCAAAPCVSACPVDAVSRMTGLDVEACARHRIGPDSACELQCLARNACPVGAEHRYDPEQMRHHYGAGLASIRRWLDG